MALSVRNICSHLPTQGPMTDWSEALFECLEYPFLIQARELVSKALQVTKCELVYHADQPEKLQERVLKGRCSEQKLRTVFERSLQRVGDHVVWLVHVAKAVGLIDHHQVPYRVRYVRCLAPCKLVGADDNLGFGLEWAKKTRLDIR